MRIRAAVFTSLRLCWLPVLCVNQVLHRQYTRGSLCVCVRGGGGGGEGGRACAYNSLYGHDFALYKYFNYHYIICATNHHNSTYDPQRQPIQLKSTKWTCILCQFDINWNYFAPVRLYLFRPNGMFVNAFTTLHTVTRHALSDGYCGCKLGQHLLSLRSQSFQRLPLLCRSEHSFAYSAYCQRCCHSNVRFSWSSNAACFCFWFVCFSVLFQRKAARHE